jgi:uncharacterized membrane protein YedE/YeeE
MSGGAPGARLGVNRPVVVAALLLLAAGAALAGDAAGGRKALLYVIGGGLGFALYHAAFGFTSAWRAFINHGRADGLRAQMLMLALASVAFLPLIEAGSLFGQPLGGALAPVGVSVLVGAALFGFGMQLGGGCASGTLYTVGGGSTRMLVTLVFFVIGALIGTAHLPWWLAQPSLGSISLGRELGLPGALALQLAAFAAIALAATWVERRRGAAAVPQAGGREPLLASLLRGPWPMIWGAVALALLNIATLLVAGHPWSITFGFSLWGAKAAPFFGVDAAAWSFWTWPYPQRALNASLFAETTSVMNFGIIVGALLAAGLAGRFAPQWRIPLRSLAAAVIGGLLMGYGARLAFGCNIGAYFSGVASGSLHGWLWLVAAFLGSILGTRLRPWFGLSR